MERDMYKNSGRFVAELRPEEPARFDPDTLEDLCHKIGEARAEAEVARALRRISDALASLPPPEHAGDAVTLNATVGALCRDADRIGMASVARVANQVLDCLARNDGRALSATLARLSRVGHRSLHAVWELEDLSG